MCWLCYERCSSNHLCFVADFDQTRFGCGYIEILYRSNFHNSSAFHLTVVNKIKIIKFLSNSATSRKLLNLLRTPASWESIKSYRFEMVGELPEDFTKYIQILSVVCLSKDIYIQIVQKRIILKPFFANVFAICNNCCVDICSNLLWVSGWVHFC